MFNKEEMIKKHEDELLEIFILVEQNNFESKKEALMRYAKWKGLKPDWYMLHNELNQHYRDFVAGRV